MCDNGCSDRFVQDDAASLKINILHFKLQAVVDAHPCAIQQLSEQAMLILEKAQKPGNLVG